MIGYVTVGTNDLEKASAFYDRICGELGMGRFMENDRLIAWGGQGRGRDLVSRFRMTASR
jgi:catechol 2,3-dioxygenase-like lactoylglutathione lyase family enzyme